MSVKLVNYSQGPMHDIMGVMVPDNATLLDQIAYCARVSNPANQNNTESSEKLVRYLIKHQHWSPLEMVSVCLEIETTRDIARQILRHRSFSFQEFSQRYADASQLGSVYRETRLQDTKNRQNSVSLNMNSNEHQNINLEWIRKQQEVLDLVEENYKWALDSGIAKEQARCILPEGNTVSRMYMNGTLRSWVHYIQLRSANGTQLEHQEIALACADAIEPIFPMIKEFVNV
jgi:thymidylate synthase (FAD)